MAFKNKIYFIILGLLVQLFFFGSMPAELLQAGDHALGEEFSLPASVLENDRLTLISFFPLIVEGDIVGGAAVYDDTTTERPADYLELYDSAGRLLAVSWFDRFGIERTAVDRGLLEDTGELEGVFVLLLDGDSV